MTTRLVVKSVARLGFVLSVLAATAQAQVTYSISPASGSSASGVAQAFTATYTDSSGYTDITNTYFIVNSSLSGASSCYVQDVQGSDSSNTLYLANDAGTAWIGPLTAGSSGTLQNSQCTVYGTGSSFSGSGTQLTMILRLSFTATFAGAKYTYMDAVSATGYSGAWAQMGMWTVNATGYPDLTIAKSHSSNFTQGQTGAAYTITATNSGSATTSGTVTVTDTLPSGLTASGMSGSGWSCNVSTVTCTRSDALAAGASYPAITLTVNVASNASTPLTNYAYVSGGGETNTSNDTASDQTIIGISGGGSSNLALNKAATQSSTYSDTYFATPARVASLAVDGNADGNYYDGFVTTTNNDVNAWWQVDLGSSATVSSVVVWNRTDCCGTRLNDYWVFVSNTPFLSTDTPSTLQSRAGTWSSHQTTAPSPSTTIAAGSAAGRYVRVQLTGQNYLSLAEVQVFGSAGASTPDLTVTMNHTPSPFIQGQTGTYNITVANSGTAATPNGTQVQVTDSLPAGLTATAMSGSGWSCTQPGGPCTRSDAWAAGSSYPVITLTANVASTAPTSVTNTVNVSGGGETNTGNDSATDTATINGGGCGTVATLATMSTPTPGTQLSGSSVTFYWNVGCNATQYYLYVGTSLGNSNIIGVSAGTALRYPVTGLPTDGTQVFVRLWSYLPAGWQYNDYSYATGGCTSGCAPNLTISKSHSGNFTQGQTGTYTITVANNGTAASSGTVTVNDTLPAGLTASSMSGNGWTCNSSTVSCNRIDALAAGGSYPPIALTVSVAGNAPTSVTNTANISGAASTTDPTTVGGSCGTLATMTSPAPGSTLSGSTVTFNWSCATGASQYYLYVGNNVGTNDLYGQSVWPLTSQAVSGLPTDGRTLYVRLWTYLSSGWQFNDYTYVAGGSFVTITVTSSPTGRSLTVDGAACSSTPCTYQWTPGSGHTIAAATQSGGTGIQYAFANWSDGGASSHTVAPAVATTYTANFTTQYSLTTAVGTGGGGTIAPSPGISWWNINSGVSVSAAASSGYNFTGFTGTTNSTANPLTITITGPTSETANFSAMQTVAAPTFNPLPGNYSAGQMVTLSTTTQQASISYTTDGSTPTETSTLYNTGGIPVTSNTTIKAIAFKTGWLDSSVLSGTFNITITGDFAIQASPSSQTIALTSQATYTLSVIPINGFTGLVTLYTEGQRSTMSNCAIVTGFSSSIMAGTPVNVTITPQSSCKPNAAYYLDFLAFAGSMQHEYVLELDVSTNPDFSFTVLNATQTLSSAGSAYYQLQASELGSFQGQVTFNVTGLPAGTYTIPQPVSISPTYNIATAVLKVTSSTSTSFTVTATSGAITHAAQSWLVVQQGAPNPATLITPTDGSNLTGQPWAFQWNAGTGLDAVLPYQLDLGSSPGAIDLYTTQPTQNQSASVTLASPPEPIYATLRSKIAGAWALQAYTLHTTSYYLSRKNGGYGVKNNGVESGLMTYCVTTQTCQNGGLPVTGNQLSNCQVLGGSVAVTKFIPGTQGTVYDFDVSFTAARTALHGDRFLQCTYNGATLKLAAALTVYDTPPVITNVVPGTLTPGVSTSVTITGSNFGPYPGSVIVSQDPQGNPASDIAIPQQPSRSAWNDNSVTVSVTPSSSASGPYDLKILSSGVYIDGFGNDFNSAVFLAQPGTNDQAQSNPKPFTVQGPPTVASLQVSQPSTPDAVTAIAPAVTPVTITDTSSAFATDSMPQCSSLVTTGCLVTVLKDSGTVTVAAAGIQPLGSGGQIQWMLQRDSSDTVDSAFICLHPPVACFAAAATGSQVTFDPSSAGNFRLIAYLDANSNGQFDEGEQLRVLRIAVVRVTLQPGATFTVVDTLYPVPGQGVASANNDGTNPAMSLSANYLLEGGGNQRTIGTSAIRIGDVGNLIGDNFIIN